MPLDVEGRTSSEKLANMNQINQFFRDKNPHLSFPEIKRENFARSDQVLELHDA